MWRLRGAFHHGVARVAVVRGLPATAPALDRSDGERRARPAGSAPPPLALTMSSAPSCAQPLRKGPSPSSQPPQHVAHRKMMGAIAGAGWALRLYNRGQAPAIAGRTALAYSASAAPPPPPQQQQQQQGERQPQGPLTGVKVRRLAPLAHQSPRAMCGGHAQALKW